MRHTIFWAWVLLLAAGTAGAADYTPNLGQTKDIIAGRSYQRTPIPENAPERNVYPLQEQHPRQIRTELQGQPFRQVTPMPLARAWWKYPLYAVAGFPRDLIDAMAGGLNCVPVVNIPLVMGAYELVPTQYLIRDPRDWHQWPGTGMNAQGHGPIDGESWGWFPSLHHWQFSYPSQDLARQNEQYNRQLKDRLDAENRAIEVKNAQYDTQLREARTRALAAIQSGNGREAALRMIGYQNHYPLDEGGFALFVTALALFSGEQAPDWVAPVLWSELEYAQPRMLAEAEKMLIGTAGQYPDRIALAEALIYIRLTLGHPDKAADAAQDLLKNKPADPYRQRLMFETALEAGDLSLARQTRQAMGPASYDEPTRQAMDLRLSLLAGDVAAAAGPLTQLQAQHPDDPYYAYYLGCAKLMLGQRLENPAAAYQQAAALLSRACDLPASPLLRKRIESARRWVDSVVSGIAAKPELFTDTGSSTATLAPVAAKPAAAPKPAKNGILKPRKKK